MVGVLNSRVLAFLNTLVDALDGGGGNGLLRLYTGTAPAPDAAATGTLLAELTLSATAFGAAADTNPGGSVTANAITQDSSANASGTVGYARLVDSTGGNAINLTVGVGSGELQLTTLTVVAGQPVQVTSLVLTMPEVV